MDDQDENIVFEEIFNSFPSGKRIYALEPRALQRAEKEYVSLYEELVDKCHPQNFLCPYNPQKVEIANDLFSEILQYKQSEELLKKVRNKAIQLLHITFSTKKLLNKLLQYCHPALYMAPYNHDNVALANKFYSKILDSNNDIIALEQIERDSVQLYDIYKEMLSASKANEDAKEKEKALQILREEEQKAMSQVDIEYLGYMP